MEKINFVYEGEAEIGCRQDLRKLSDERLTSELKMMVKKERQLLSTIILHIAEIDRRRLFLTLAYPSLFDYLLKHIGYSAGSAQRRIDAARLLNQVPEVATRLNTGALNLAQISYMQKSIRQIQSSNSQKISSDVKKKICLALENKTFAESQTIINTHLNIDPIQDSKIAHQADESVRLEITFTPQQWKKLLQARDALSHVIPTGAWDQVIESLSDMVKPKSKSPEKLQKNYIKDVVVPEVQSNVGIMVEGHPGLNSVQKNNHKSESKALRKAIPIKIRKHLISNRAKCCYENKVTNKQCGSTWQLSLDHIQPVWAGGSNDCSNLRVLCANHNRHLYRTQSGIKLV